MDNALPEQVVIEHPDKVLRTGKVGYKSVVIAADIPEHPQKRIDGCDRQQKHRGEHHQRSGHTAAGFDPAFFALGFHALRLLTNICL